MKKALLSILFACVSLCISSAQTASDSQQRAIKKYPELGVAGSTLNKAFVAEVNRRKQATPDFFRAADWPMRLAEELTAPPPKPAAAKIEVTNLIVKRVTVEGFLGNSRKFRYFFAAKNTGTAPFNGTVEVTLLNKMQGIKNGKEVFECNIEPGLQKVGYIDASTGPERFHADASVARFSFVATAGADVVANGDGAITDRFEELP